MTVVTWQRILHMSYHYDPSGIRKLVITPLENPKITTQVLARKELINKILYKGHSTASRAGPPASNSCYWRWYRHLHLGRSISVRRGISMGWPDKQRPAARLRLWNFVPVKWWGVVAKSKKCCHLCNCWMRDHAGRFSRIPTPTD